MDDEQLYEEMQLMKQEISESTYRKVKGSFEDLYRFCFFVVVGFFAINLIILLTSVTFVFLMLIVNHILVPISRSTGLY
jgi:hypothetical protein